MEKEDVYMKNKYSDQDFTLSAEDSALDEDFFKESKKKQEIDLYHDILWIDDRQNNNAENNAWTWMKDYCEKETIRAQIDQVDSFFDAVDKIVKNSAQYDLVIFDINLEKCFDGVVTDQTKRDKIEKVFRDYHIGLKDGGTVTFEELGKRKKIAGYYLFRLLLAVGYPLSRMLIFSANSELNYSEKKQALYSSSASDNTNAEAQKELDLIIDDRIRISKSDHPEKLQPEIEKRFSGENNYYRIRRLVFQACDYWKKELEKLGPKEIPFNKLYNLAIDKKSFSGMFEHIKMLFPVKQPINRESVYYRAMQIASAFHENSAGLFTKENPISSYPILQKFHFCIRNFRNWSSHNKMKTILNDDQFASLFCIALRTYFSWENEVNGSSQLLDYEMIYGFCPRESFDKKELKDFNYYLWDEIRRHLIEYADKDSKNKYKNYNSNLNQAIHDFGMIKEMNNMEFFLFIPVWCINFNYKIDYYIADTGVSATYKLDESEVKKMIKIADAGNQKSVGCFMQCCYEYSHELVKFILSKLDKKPDERTLIKFCQDFEKESKT